MSNKPKPIVLASLNKLLSIAEINEITALIERIGMNNDYYFLTIFDANQKENIKFQVFYEKDFNKVKYEELKKIIKDKLKR